MIKLFNYCFKTVPLCFVLICFIGCAKDDEINSNQQELITQSNMKIISSSDIPEVMDYIKTINNGTLTFMIENEENGEMRNHEDDLIITSVQTEQINQVINGFGKSSFTFKMEEEQDKEGIYFINLNVKEHLDSYYMFFTKYVPDLEWLSSYSDESDFANFNGNLYFYDENGTYLAKVEMENGVSSSFYKNDCNDNSNTNGGTDDSTPGDPGDSGSNNGDNGGNLVDDIEVSYGWLCNWRGQLHGYPSACDNPGMGGTWTMLIDYGNGNKSMSHYLKNSCDDNETEPCYNYVGDPCPNGCDENGNCIEDDEVENSGSGVNVDFAEIMALLNELRGILGENSSIVINNELSLDSTIPFNSIADFQSFHENFESSVTVDMEVIEESQNTKVNKYSYVLNNTLNSEIIFLVEVELPDSNSDECLTVTDVTSYHSGSSLLFVEWDPDDLYDVFVIEETNETQVDLYGRYELGFSLEGISFTVSYLYLFSMQIDNDIGLPSGFTSTRID